MGTSVGHGRSVGAIAVAVALTTACGSAPGASSGASSDASSDTTATAPLVATSPPAPTRGKPNPRSERLETALREAIAAHAGQRLRVRETASAADPTGASTIYEVGALLTPVDGTGVGSVYLRVDDPPRGASKPECDGLPDPCDTVAVSDDLTAVVLSGDTDPARRQSITVELMRPDFTQVIHLRMSVAAGRATAKFWAGAQERMSAALPDPEAVVDIAAALTAAE